jgi:hypothetical protein
MHNCIMKNDDISPLTVLATCTGGTCPTVYATGRGTVLVQGYIVTAATAGVQVPEGEQLVEIPSDLLARALQAAEGA